MTDQDQRQFAIQRLYLKDVSFETPNVPAIFRDDWEPESNLSLNTQVTGLDQDIFEVTLVATLTVKLGERTAYVVEAHQAGIFTLKGFQDQERAHMLGAFCPNILFPYAREVITDLVTKGSFPQMILQPVNFDALFVQHQQELARRTQTGGYTLN